MPSPIAVVFLLLLVPLGALAFATLRPVAAAAAVIVGTYLFGPCVVALDAPMLPAFDKFAIATMIVLAGVGATSPRLLSALQPVSWVGAFAALGLVGALLTVFGNPDTLSYGTTVLPGLTPYDGLSAMIGTFIGGIAPFFVGQLVFGSSSDAARTFLHAIVLGALLCAPLMAYEMAFGPVFHLALFGFHQSDVGHAMRGSGFRPIAFAPTGLSLALFVSTAVLAAWTLARSGRSTLLGSKLSSLALLGWLALLRSAGALVFALIALPVLALTRARRVVATFAILAVMVGAYPVLRAANVFPTWSLTDAIGRIAPERAYSLGYRFYNEDVLLARGRERLLFGWGGYGRNQIYDDEGNRLTIADGYWIIVFGHEGLVGFLSAFGLLLAPILGARAALRGGEARTDALVLGYLLIAFIHVVDLIPNGMFSYFNLIFCGTLSGLARSLPKEQRRRAQQREAAGG